MAALDKEQSLALLRVLVKGQNRLKSASLDLFEAAISSDRQYDAAKRSLKNTESALRKIIKESLEDLGITEKMDIRAVMELK